MLQNLHLLLITPILVVTILTFSQAFGQTLSTTQNTDAIYAISIVPGAAQRDNTLHYYPPVIAVPIDTTVAWFNNDVGQPHTVTSGALDDPNSGSIFNSGIMPATANSFFQYTFSDTGDIIYHCEIHPWRIGVVSTSNAYATGSNFKISYGGGIEWDVDKSPRSLMVIEPVTVSLDRTTPISYNFTIKDTSDKILYSNSYNTIGESLPIELVFEGNETRSYGPDFSSTGTYHVLAGFLEKNKDYKIISEIKSINYQKPESKIIDEFIFKTS